MSMRVHAFVPGLVVLGSVLAAGCAKEPPAEATIPAVATTTPEATKVADLMGPDWKLESFDPGSPVPPEVHITLSVSVEKLSGKGGCNRYMGSIQDGEAPGEIKLGPLALTRMSCDGAADAAEARYVAALQNARSFRIEQGRLLLTYQDGESTRTLTYSRA